MLRQKECLGLALAAFGVGLVLAIVLQSLLCRFLLGTGCILAGCFLLK